MIYRVFGLLSWRFELTQQTRNSSLLASSDRLLLLPLKGLDPQEEDFQ